jgi:hypothetical protein
MKIPEYKSYYYYYYYHPPPHHLHSSFYDEKSMIERTIQYIKRIELKALIMTTFLVVEDKQSVC